MEKKQAYHVEWGQLQLKGQAPIMAGAAIGASQLMWVACRTSKYLVHVFQDAQLMSIWRFTSDPVFLLFGPSSRDQAADPSAKRLHTSSNNVTKASLLVITSDGRIWHLDVSDSCRPLNYRSTKKRKEAIPCELPKAAHETLITEADSISSFAPKSSQKHEGDQNEDPAVCASKLDKLHAGPKSGRGMAELGAQDGGDVSANCRAGLSSAGSRDRSGSRLLWEKLAVHSHATYPEKPGLRLVPATALLGIAPAASLAAYSPNGFVALLTPSGAFNIIQIGLSHPSGRTSGIPVRDVGDAYPPTRSREPTCILSVSAVLEGDTVLPRGDAAVVSKKLFESIFGEVHKTTPTFGLLQGDSDGFVYTISLKPSETVVESCTRVLYNVAQPIVAILAIPCSKSAGQKEFQGDSLLILGQLGRAILITGVMEESDELEKGPFLPVRRCFSWRTKDKSSTAAQLTEKNLTIQEWDLNSSIVSACMLGPYRLCYCSRSSILYADLFEIIRHGTIHLNSARIETISGAGTGPIMPFTSNSEPSRKRLGANTSASQQDKWTVKEELVPFIVPVADAVVAIAGSGILGRSGGSRPLVALTARGRLLGIEVSDHVSSPALNNEIDVQKSWQSSHARKEERIKDLLQAVAEVTECTEVIRSHHISITLALKEFAIAFPLIHDICSDQTRDVIRCPDLSLVGEAPEGKVWCFLTVSNHPSVVLSPGNLSFGPTEQRTPSNYCSNPHSVKISIRLLNQTYVTLSPYWSLVLELHNLYPDPTEVVSYSRVINGRMGLVTGAHYSYDFLVELPSTSLCPLLASLFLCHLHDPHQSTIDSKSPGSKALSGNLKGSVPLKIASDVGGEPPNLWVVSVEENPGSFGSDGNPEGETFGSVCLLMSNSRIDLLSLLRPPIPQSGISPWTFTKMSDRSKQMEDSSNVDHLLGIFSANLLLSSVQNSTFPLTDMGSFWQELHLRDLIQRGNPSEVAERISSSAPDDGTLSIAIKCTPAKGSCSISLLFQASTLLLGSLAREALLWRISKCETKFLLQESIPGNPTDAGKILANSQMKEGTLHDVHGLVQQLQTLTSLWKMVSGPRDAAVFASLLDDTGSVIIAVLTVYKAQREHSLSPCIS